MTTTSPVLSKFAKVNFFRNSLLYFTAEVQHPVLYCPRGREPVTMSSTVQFGLRDDMVQRIPWLKDLSIGEIRTRKVRLRTLGYDRHDRAVT